MATGTSGRLLKKQIDNFSAGLNSSAYDFWDIGPDETYSSFQVRITDQGHLETRPGCPASSDFPAPPSANAVANLYWSEALSVAILQVGNTLYKCAIGGGSWTSFRTCSTSSRVEFCDFGTKLVYVHPADGVRTYDGATDASVSTVAKGKSIAVWQNKVWVGSDTGPTYWWSAAGDVTSWTTGTDVNQVRDKDTKGITAMFPSSGLIIFKEDSFYRVNDSTTGAYQTVDVNNGALAQRAVTGSQSNIYFMGLTGIFRTTGFSPAEDISRKISGAGGSGTNIWSRSFGTMNKTTRDRISAIQLEQGVYFTYPEVSTTEPDGFLEYNPNTGSWMKHYLTLSGNTRATLGGLAKYPDANGFKTGLMLNTTTPTINSMFTSSGNSVLLDGVTYSWTWRSGFQIPHNLGLVRLRRIRFYLQNKSNSNLPTYQFTLNYTGSNESDSYSIQIPATSNSAKGFQFFPNKLVRAFTITAGYSVMPANNSGAVIRGFEYDYIPIEEP